MTNKFGTTDDWDPGDVLKSADLLDTFGNVTWNSAIQQNVEAAGYTRGICTHSSTKYSMVEANGNILQSTDSGVSWASRNTDLDATTAFMKICGADPTHAFCIETGTTNECAFTDDSGDAWTTKTSAAFGTGLYDVSFTTASLIVLGGNDSGGTDHIVFSTDDGGTWTNATTSPSLAVWAVHMFDANTGYAIDEDGNIWKTTNAAVTWVDTTDDAPNYGANNTMSIYCVSATKAIITYKDGAVVVYNNSTNTSTLTLRQHGNMANAMTLGILEHTDGQLYVGWSGGVDSSVGLVMLGKSPDDGDTWKLSSYPTLKGIGASVHAKSGSLADDGTYNQVIAVITEIPVKIPTR